MTETRKLRVFLCHSSQDKPIVRELYQRLLAEGWIDPWLDEEKLLPGQKWAIEIEKAVETTDAVIVFISNNSLTKDGFVQRELSFALDIAMEKTEDAIFLIPVRLDDCKPPKRLQTWHYVDYFPDYQKSDAINRLLESLKSRKATLKVDDFIFPITDLQLPIVDGRDVLNMMRLELKPWDMSTFEEELSKIFNLSLGLDDSSNITVEIREIIDKLANRLKRHFENFNSILEESRLLYSKPIEESINIGELLAEVRNEYIDRFKNNMRLIEIEVDNALMGVNVAADKNHLVLVFRNLLNNSLRATEIRSVKNRRSDIGFVEKISIELAGEIPAVELIYRDNGCGLPNDIRNKLYKEKCSDQPSELNGLGGLIIGKLLGLNGGSIEILASNQSGSQIGTKQKIILPHQI